MSWRICAGARRTHKDPTGKKVNFETFEYVLEDKYTQALDHLRQVGPRVHFEVYLRDKP